MSGVFGVYLTKLCLRRTQKGTAVTFLLIRTLIHTAVSSSDYTSAALMSRQAACNSTNWVKSGSLSFYKDDCRVGLEIRYCTIIKLEAFRRIQLWLIDWLCEVWFYRICHRGTPPDMHSRGVRLILWVTNWGFWIVSFFSTFFQLNRKINQELFVCFIQGCW
jgi:hypothetical protein